MAPDVPETGPDDSLLVTLLSVGWNYRQAGERVGLSERTVKRRMADPTFRRRVAGARQEMAQAAAGQLTAGMVKAAKTLIELMDAEKEKGATRLGAAKALLEYAGRFSPPPGPPQQPPASVEF